jgi:hypothetical protein
LLSILIKRAGLAMGIFFIYMIVEQIIVGVLRGIYKVNVADYFPEEVTDRLIPFPYIKVLTTPEEATRWEHHIPIYLCVGVLYIFIYCLVTGRYFLKNDL